MKIQTTRDRNLVHVQSFTFLRRFFRHKTLQKIPVRAYILYGTSTCVLEFSKSRRVRSNPVAISCCFLIRTLQILTSPDFPLRIDFITRKLLCSIKLASILRCLLYVRILTSFVLIPPSSRARVPFSSLREFWTAGLYPNR